MTGSVLDILIYVFDQYMLAEAPEVPEREALAADLERAGFGRHNVERALDWLADLAGERSRPDMSSRALRVFSEEELEALVLGSRWVARAAEPRLAGAGADALAKIAAVLPADMREMIDSAALFVGPKRRDEDKADVSAIRRAIRLERILELHYGDEQGRISRRRVWPFALGYFEHVRVLIAWCELRQDFRHFRTDRIIDMALHEGRYPRRRTVLLKEWRETQDVPMEN